MATHFTGPVLHKDQGTKRTRGWYANLPAGEDPDYVVWMNDFTQSQDYAAADWTITTVEAGGGDATEALAGDELNGALLITNDSNDNDSDSLQQNEETWKLASGKRLWYETRIKINDVDQVDDFIGLAITDTTPLDTTDRIGFQIVDGNASVQVLAEKDSTETNTDSGKDMVDDTYIKLGFLLGRSQLG